MLFASGSPFDPITDAQGIAHHPPQANNAYIFPAVGHAAVLTKSKRVPEVHGACGRVGIVGGRAGGRTGPVAE